MFCSQAHFEVPGTLLRRHSFEHRFTPERPEGVVVHGARKTFWVPCEFARVLLSELVSVGYLAVARQLVFGRCPFPINFPE